MDIDRFRREIELLAPVGSHHHTAIDWQTDIHQGTEHRTDPRSYSWDGRTRGGGRHVVLQYTLGGWGAWRDGPAERPSGIRRVRPGELFAAVIPSDHCYFLPPESSGWRFVWLTLRHPYVVDRIEAEVSACGPVQAVAPDSPFACTLARIVASLVQQRYRDRLTIEADLFSLLVDFSRAWRQAADPQRESEELLERMRRFVRDHAHRFVDIDELAASFGQSRTAFSHRFRRLTGQTPAACLVQLRLAEARHRLATSDETLEAVASACGFADANHLCKVFRRELHLTPGMFRQQTRGG